MDNDVRRLGEIATQLEDVAGLNHVDDARTISAIALRHWAGDLFSIQTRLQAVLDANHAHFYATSGVPGDPESETDRQLVQRFLALVVERFGQDKIRASAKQIAAVWSVCESLLRPPSPTMRAMAAFTRNLDPTEAPFTSRVYSGTIRSMDPTEAPFTSRVHSSTKE